MAQHIVPDRVPPSDADPFVDQRAHGMHADPTRAACDACPAAGTETCETLAELGSYCAVTVAAHASRETAR
jgi:hypothetical protein